MKTYQELLKEYNNGVRGKYAERHAKGAKVIVTRVMFKKPARKAEPTRRAPVGKLENRQRKK